MYQKQQAINESNSAEYEEEQKIASQNLQIQAFHQSDLLIGQIYGEEKNNQSCYEGEDHQGGQEMDEDDFLNIIQFPNLSSDGQVKMKETVFKLQLENRNLKQELEAEKKKNLKLLDIAKIYLENYQLLQKDYAKIEQQKQDLELQIYDLQKREIQKQLRMQKLSEPKTDYSSTVSNAVQKQTNLLKELKTNQKYCIIRKIKNPQSIPTSNFENKGSKEPQKKIQNSNTKQSTYKCVTQNIQQEQQAIQKTKRLTFNKLQK